MMDSLSLRRWMDRQNAGATPDAKAVKQAASFLKPNLRADHVFCPDHIWVAQWVSELDDALFSTFIQAGGGPPLKVLVAKMLAMAEARGVSTKTDLRRLALRVDEATLDATLDPTLESTLDAPLTS